MHADGHPDGHVRTSCLVQVIRFSFSPFLFATFFNFARNSARVLNSKLGAFQKYRKLTYEF